jgi:cation transport ATPase
MRGGALAPLIWALLLAALAITNAIWTAGNVIQGGTFAAAVGSIVALAVLLIVLSPEARHKGAPELRTRAAALPSGSFAAMLAGLALGCFAFGFAFGRFPIFFGAGLLVVALGRLSLELRAQRRAVRSLHRREDA